jgi:hypothetical protein
MSRRKYRGGLYVWRTRKPWAIFGLPLIGRHFAYAGMTNSYSAREGQHLNGSVTYDKPAASWSDLKPKCYRIFPLPDWMTRGKWGRKLVKALETVLIALTLPIYNERQQAPWNFRKVSRKEAALARERRNEYGRYWNIATAIWHWAFTALGAAVAFGIFKIVGWL